MPPTRVRADYEELADIANVFSRQADRIDKMARDLKSQHARLADGAWRGRGAGKFYLEMDGKVHPALKKLHSALAEAAQTTKRISQVMRKAEEDAARVLRWNGDELRAKASTGAASAGAPSNLQASGSTLPPSPRLTGNAAQDVGILTRDLKKYGVDVNFVGTYTDQQKVTMLSNIHTAVWCMTANTNGVLRRENPYSAFGEVFGPTQITVAAGTPPTLTSTFNPQTARLEQVITGGGMLTDPATGAPVYGYNSGLYDQTGRRLGRGDSAEAFQNGVNHITLSAPALLYTTSNPNRISPIQLVAHEIGHNLSSQYLNDNRPDENHGLMTDSRIPEGWNILVNARSTHGPAEFTADYIAHWGLYGPANSPAAVTEFMSMVIQSEVVEPRDPVHVYYNNQELIDLDHLP